jgi:hypothetical protein
MTELKLNGVCMFSQLLQEEWSHIKMAVRLFNIMLQQQAGRRPNKKALVADFKRLTDDFNAAGKVTEGGRVVFQVDYTKYVWGRAWFPSPSTVSISIHNAHIKPLVRGLIQPGSFRAKWKLQRVPHATSQVVKIPKGTLI